MVTIFKGGINTKLTLRTDLRDAFWLPSAPLILAVLVKNKGEKKTFCPVTDDMTEIHRNTTIFYCALWNETQTRLTWRYLLGTKSSCKRCQDLDRRRLLRYTQRDNGMNSSSGLTLSCSTSVFTSRGSDHEKRGLRISQHRVVRQVLQMHSTKRRKTPIFTLQTSSQGRRREAAPIAGDLTDRLHTMNCKGKNRLKLVILRKIFPGKETDFLSQTNNLNKYALSSYAIEGWRVFLTVWSGGLGREEGVGQVRLYREQSTQTI